MPSGSGTNHDSAMPSLDLSKLSCVVLDHGPFAEVALRLARDFGTVHYVCPQWEEAFSKIDWAIVGDGIGEINRVDEIWDVIDKVDLAVFPDVHHGGMQLAIEKYVQVPVWGARRADRLELRKLEFKKLQKKLGMNFAPYEVIEGLDALREFCRDPKNKDCWIKGTPQYRGNKETFQVKDYETARQHIAEMEAHFGPLSNLLRFIAERDLPSNLEGGIDTYTVDGQHPVMAVLGYERKDQCYFACVKPYDEIDSRITCVNEFLWPTLKEYRCRQMLSTEVKVMPDDESNLLEPTVRMPSPAGEEQMEIYGNFSEILYRGAQGELVEPDIEWEYACEAMVEHTGDDDHWRGITVPKSVRRWVKLYSPVQWGSGDQLAVAPGCEVIGAVVGVGHTPDEALDHLKENAACLKGEKVVIHIEAIAGVLEEIEEAESKGIDFSDHSIPEPAAVLE